MTKSRSIALLILMLLLVAAVALSGVQFQPGEWYATLQKPFWTPPNWLFPPVWSFLYLMIAFAGWLIFQGDALEEKILWIAQLMANGLWSWLFFGLHRVGLGLIDIIVMTACIAAIVMLCRKKSKAITWLMTPYLLWVSYASTLNAAIYFLNPS